MARPSPRRLTVAALYTLVFVLLAVAATWLSVRITPMQTVSAAGQTMRVGVMPPQLNLSGPGELVLFGQKIPTEPRFDGPIRPRLVLAHITPGHEVAELLKSGDHGKLTLAVGHRLTSGWVRYALWETAVAAGVVLVVSTAATGVRRMPPRRTVGVLAAGLAMVCVVNLVGFGLLASGTLRVLGHVHSLDDLVGHSPLTPVPAAVGPPLGHVQVVVLGDSTAAGTGNRPLPNPSALDTACARSADSYAQALAKANRWDVLNLACSGATVRDGILGVQIVGDRVAPPQLAQAQRASKAAAVIVSIGANDVRWADLTRLCIAAKVCDDRATNASFRGWLARFTLDYRTLLRQLSTLPQHQTVLINAYYDPFGPDIGCLKREGLTKDKTEVLRARLGSLNTVLREGAEAAGFPFARPHFTGHELCSSQPYVQGPADKAPLHPTAAGELAIALADQRFLSHVPG
ncbi:SGNH/GDSL hydrolase family protein [Streptomyces sp. NPDC014983]|uniref:SGNH/GDSL hydrolase family protein n=1 Tax=Streptomyces sp. NPDC014983 TaxID=3364933 RepID=UPI0037007B69